MSLFTQRLSRRPELLLLLGVLMQFLLTVNTALDFHLSDTYIVFGAFTWPNLLLQLLFYSPVLLSWFLHRRLRKAGVPLYRWRWIQIIITFICLLLNIVLALFTDMYHIMPRYYDYTNWHSRLGAYITPTIPILVIIITQLLFWIIAIILLIRKKRLATL